MFAQSLSLATLALASITSALPLEKRTQTTGTTHLQQVIAQDFADPSIIQVGNTWYGFATNNHKTLGNAAAVGSNSLINVQIATSNDFNTWTVTGQDALPTVGAWAGPNTGVQGPAVWAPNVIQNAAGQFVLHYSAASLGNPGKHCIGAAYANTPEGPYTPQPDPIACPTSQGGAIDSSSFKDADGSYYIVYKIDGNSIGHGGSCGNSVAPEIATPVMLQKLSSDAMTPTGSPTELIDHSPLDGPLIEAPALMRSAGGKYVLFFSSNCFASEWYDVTYAFADNIAGPYVKRGPMLVTGSQGLYSPGGMHVAADGQHMVFHAGNVGPSNTGWRSMYTMQITVDDVNEVVNS